MPVTNKIRRKGDNSMEAVLAEFALYLEEEKLKARREVSQQIQQMLHPLLQRIDKTPLSKSDLAAQLQRKLAELIASPSPFLRRTLSQLSPAEWQVCQRLRQGQRTKQIAEELNLSPATVENQRNAIRRKLGLAHSENLVTFLQQL